MALGELGERLAATTEVLRSPHRGGDARHSTLDALTRLGAAYLAFAEPGGNERAASLIDESATFVADSMAIVVAAANGRDSLD